MASSLLKIEKEKFESTVGMLKQASNGVVIEKMTGIAQKLAGAADSNELVAKLVAAFKKYQELYNVELEGIDKVIEQMGAIYDIGEFLQKGGNVGEVSNRNTSFDVKPISSPGLNF